MITTSKIDLEKLVNTELPPLPGSALRVSSLTQDMDASTRSIADAIGLDPVLAARVLRTANSPLYSMERHVTSLTAAVNILGNNAIHMLVLISAAGGAFGPKGNQSKFEHALWEHSVAVGLAAREVSHMLGMRGVEEAFLCGLLHDIGKLLLVRYDPESYEVVKGCEGEQESLECEQELYGYTHSQVGALVAKRWNLPDELSYAIYNHHQPSEAGNYMFMARVIDIANNLATAGGKGTRPVNPEEVQPFESAMALRLSEEQLAEIWAKTEKNLNAMVDLFK
jgi:putative nucleotidyltransferase with HDIG domain